jgi:hypothetical protein
MRSDRSPSPHTPSAAGGRFLSAVWPALGAALALLLGFALAGCASPNEPTTRHPVIPQTVQDLAARQQGKAVALSFTLPTRSTRPEPLAEPPAVEIYRGALDPGAATPRKAKMQLVYTIPGDLANSYEQNGRIAFHDALGPNELGRSPGASMVYMVRTRAAENRASAESNFVTVRIHPPPEPVGGEVRAVVVGQSVNVLWSPADAPALNRIYRAEIAPESATAAAVDASQAIVRIPLTMVGEVTTVATGLGPATFGDGRLELGHTYLYIVRRVAQFDGDTVESADSKPAVVTVAEAIPLAAPQEVQAVAIPATPQAAVYVELSWAISAETNLAGYAVYRSEQPDMPGARLNDQLLPTPTFRDLSVAPGRRYFYRIAGVDGAGNEGPLSPAVEADVP